MAKKIEPLTGKQARYLRGLAHSMKPLLQVGKGGITEDFINQVRKDLEKHELLKVKLIKTAPTDLKTAAYELADKVPCQVAQKIGKTVLLFKQRDEDSEIKLPK